MDSLIRKVLDRCGYDCDPTEDNVIQAFLDYVDSGIFRNLSLDEAEEMVKDGDITIEDICRNLLKKVG
jgi:hypothetical protein